MVFEILNQNDLNQYYQIENRPGISLKGERREKYAWLDDAEIVEKLTDFQNEKVTKVTLHLPLVWGFQRIMFIITDSLFIR